ncbi:MAG TPA: hypothetical protein VGS08_05760 [Candidatus Saccharimonadales bacterium]|nr:hypothetical protein [Candidatus Saccharimonadales bacterium]
MTNHEFSHNQELATADQAVALLGEMATLITTRGKNYGESSIASADVPEMPSEIAAHLPEQHPTSIEVKDSIDIMQLLDRDSGQPLREGTVGIVKFTRREKVDRDLTYATHVNYHITTEDGSGTYSLERRVTNTEYGSRKVREAREWRARALGDPKGTTNNLLQEVTSLLNRIDVNEPMEKAMGMFDVTQKEAQQVIDYVHYLNGGQ